MKLKEFLKKRWIILLVGILVITFVTAAAFTLFGEPADEPTNREGTEESEKKPKDRVRLDLTALLSDKGGVNTESEFMLTLPKNADLDTNTVRQGLKITPPIDYELSTGDKGILIKPKAHLLANTVYTFQINLPEKNIKESWAFQTRREFQAVASLPRDKGTHVPLNSGIEITFSHENIKNIEQNFSIEPKTEGTFELHKDTVVFVPKALEPDTIYTVTLGRGITQADSGETLKEDYTFSFQTVPRDAGTNTRTLSIYELLHNFPSDFQPVFSVDASRNYQGAEMDVSIYRYHNADDFIRAYDQLNQSPEWAIFDKRAHSPDVTGLTLYKSYTQPLTFMDETYYATYLTLPENLPEGHYLLVMESGGVKDYTFVQINDMQLYASIGENETLIWVNDMRTGKPVAGAAFEGNGVKPVKTDPDGIALIGEDLFKKNTGRNRCFKVVRDDHPALVVPLYNSSYRPDEDEKVKKQYWSTIYFDRSNYLPTDSVKIWGALRPRNGSAPPGSVTLNLVNYEYDYATYSYNAMVLESKQAALTPAGTFTSEFSFENLPDNPYIIEVVSQGKVVAERYFYVNKYVKSQYVVSIKPEHKAYFGGETYKAQIGCEFFEGTPVSGYEMKYSVSDHFYQSIGSGELVINNQGLADLSVQLPDNDKPVSWYPESCRIYVSNKNPEETEVYNSEYFYIYPRDVMVKTKADHKEGTANIRFETNIIDLSKVRETGKLYGADGNPLYKGISIDRKMKATLYERYWDKKETGQYYDMISKQTYKNYEYFEVKNPIGSFEVQTVGGIADYTLEIPGYSNKKCYMLEVETLDTKNRPIKEEVFIANWDNFWYGYGYGQDYYHLDFKSEDRKYEINENIEFSLKKNFNDEITGGSTLYMVVQEGIKSYWRSQSTEQNIPFDPEYVPNAYIQAVYFDGRFLHQTYEHLVRYDPSEKELDIRLETGKESYSPGEKVDASITVMDQSGKPVQADVNISVVDEAYFALYGQTADTLEDLYRSVFSPGILNTYISYRSNIRGPGGAEGGEGEDEGGDGVRRNFVDCAFFKTITTDQNGNAGVSFVLPDNLTSWRITYQALTQHLQAGTGTKNITTRRPFFVRAIMNDTYLENDAPNILIKGYGEEAGPDDEVSFRITLKDTKGDAVSLEGKGKGGEFTELKLPPLKEGLYTVTVEGMTGSLKDAIEKTTQVRKSLLFAKQVDYHTLSSGLKLEDIDGCASLSFYNANLNDYYSSLLKLYWSWGNRLDQTVARNVSRSLLTEHFDLDFHDSGEKSDLSPYQKEDGGFALLPYGSSDVELSAKMAALCAEDINTTMLARYFEGIIDDPTTTPLQVSAAYYGLASLRKPVLLELQKFMTQGDMTLIEKLYLANALAVLGDFKGAEKVHEEISAAYGRNLKPYRVIDAGGDKDDILEHTALMAMLAVRLGTEDSMAYFKYIEQNSPDETLINLERLILVKQGLPHVSRNSSFTIEIDGRKETIRLEGTKPVTMMLSKDKIDTLKFSNIKGDIALAVSYEKMQNPSKGSDVIASITRSYNGQNGEPVTLKRTDMVTITIDIAFTDAAPEGFYEITDVLPSGLRYIYPYQAQVDQWYFGEPDGQRVRLGCYHKGGQGTKQIKYNARVSSPGQFMADHALVKHSESDAKGYSPRMSVKIE